MTNNLNITLPVSRVVQGSLYQAQDKDFDGKPLTIKTGPNAGQPAVRYYFAIAIPKDPQEQHWAQSQWGAQIYAVGQQAFPQQFQHRDFSWKVEDGDSAEVNKRGGKNCDKEGFPGHWIVKLSSGFAPKCYRSDDGGRSWQPLTEPGFIKCGYYVQVAISCAGNGQANNPGVFINPNLVAFNNYGEEIVSGPDPNAVGFAAPTATGMPPAMGMPAAAPAFTPAPAAAPVAAPAFTPAPVATPVQPNPAFLNVPAAAPAPAAPAVAPAPAVPAHTMTAKAAGVAYEAFIANGWTDVQLKQQGYME